MSVLLQIDALPFFLASCALVILIYYVIRKLHYFASLKYIIHNIWVISSSIPTSSDSVDIFVFSFCLFEADYMAPLPMDIMPPVWIFVPWWTANAASTHHFTVSLPLDSNVSIRSLMPLWYFRIFLSFLSSSSLSSFTWVVSNSTVIRMLGRACLHRNSSSDTIVWNTWASLLLSLRAVSFPSKILFAAGAMPAPWYLSCRSSRIILDILSCWYLLFSARGSRSSSPGIHVPFLGGLLDLLLLSITCYS